MRESFVEPLRVAWAACGQRSGNYGDQVNGLVCSTLSGAVVERAEDNEVGFLRADLVAIGSYAGRIPEAFSGWVWGTGLMHEEARVYARHARVAALRGPLTARRWPGRPEVPLGDPGLLAPAMQGVTRADAPTYALGVVPHYADFGDERLAEFGRRNWGRALIIDPCAQDMAARIALCGAVLASCLHGLVVADALGIPNGRICLGDRVQGGDFKFRDYVGAYGVGDRPTLPWDPGIPVEELVDKVRTEWTWGDKIAGVQRALRAAFPRDLVVGNGDAG